MKNLLDLYARPRDPKRPLVCFDEQIVQLVADKRTELPLRPGYARRRDYEYVRRGTRNLFVFVEPKAGKRQVLVTRQRKKEDCAKALRYLVDELHPTAEAIDLVCDNLNTHTPEALIEIFGKREAERILARLRFHFTPLHASWLNIAEIELSALTRQCLARRIPDEWTLWLEIMAWELERNVIANPINWSFTWKRAKRIFRKRRCTALTPKTTGQN